MTTHACHGPNRRCAAANLLLVALLLAGCTIRALAAPAGEEVRAADLTCDQEGWVLEIPFAGQWTSWAMNNPPRIVVDLIGGRSRLPRAPSLYSLDLPSGPVSLLRTSQFSSKPGDWRVRFTLVLDEPLRYEETRGDGVRIKIPCPPGASWGDPWQLHVGPGGVTAGSPAAARPAGAPERPVRGVPDSLSTLDAAVLETLLGDSAFIEVGTRRVRSTWEVAAARLVEDAQASYLEGDTAQAMERLCRCERFYADTDPGRQATLLCHFFLRTWGRVVEVDLHPRPPREGPWPLLMDATMERLFHEAGAIGDLDLAAQVVDAWGQAQPHLPRFARAALWLAQSYLDESRKLEAAAWIVRAMEADARLELSARALLLHASSRAAAGAWEDADTLLARAEARADSSLLFRVRTTRADLRYRSARYREAAQLYAKIAEQDAPPVETEWALYQLGNCWSFLGDVERAQQYFSRVAEGPAEGFWAPFARMRLLRLEEGRYVIAER